MKPFETGGHWWLPFSTESEKVCGILKLTHEKGLELNLRWCPSITVMK